VPFKIKYQPRRLPKGRPWKIYNLDTGKIVGTSKTEKNARASVRARGRGHKKGK